MKRMQTRSLVSRDEAAVHLLFARARRRAWTLAFVEAVGWGAGAAAVSPVAGVIVAAAVIAWRSRRSARPQIVRALDRGTTGVQNVLVPAAALVRGSLPA